jgi:hypothetical protein
VGLVCVEPESQSRVLCQHSARICLMRGSKGSADTCPRLLEGNEGLALGMLINLCLSTDAPCESVLLTCHLQTS